MFGGVDNAKPPLTKEEREVLGRAVTSAHERITEVVFGPLPGGRWSGWPFEVEVGKIRYGFQQNGCHVWITVFAPEDKHHVSTQEPIRQEKRRLHHERMAQFVKDADAIIASIPEAMPKVADTRAAEATRREKQEKRVVEKLLG